MVIGRLFLLDWKGTQMIGNVCSHQSRHYPKSYIEYIFRNHNHEQKWNSYTGITWKRYKQLVQVDWCIAESRRGGHGRDWRFESNGRPVYHCARHHHTVDVKRFPDVIHKSRSLCAGVGVQIWQLWKFPLNFSIGITGTAEMTAPYVQTRAPGHTDYGFIVADAYGP